MKLFNRLCIFLLGFVMGIVGCVGGLAGGIYYAYTGLKVEDFTGVLTKDQIPVLDEDSKNFTQMSLEEIINKIMILNNIDEITLGNLETTLGLDLSSLNIPDEVKDWPLSKLWGEGGFEEFAEYVTVGALYDLVTETFGVDWLADNYSELFGEGGKLRNVTLADFLKEDGYINILVDVKIKDLLPASLLESLPDYLRTLIEAIGSVSLGNLLRALIKGDIDVLEVIFNTPEIKELVLSDLFPEVLDPIAKLLEGIKLGDFLYYADGELVFDADVLLKAITIYDILCLAGFANYTPEELLDLLPDGELKDRLSVIMYMSLYQIIYESEVEDYLGDLTIGGIADAFLELAEASNAISELPEPIPTIWDKIRVIKIIDIVNGIKNENYAFILDDCLYTLTLNDLFGSYLDDELLKQLPEPVPGLWYILKDLTIGFFVNDIASLPDKFVNYTVRDMVGVYFFEGEFKFGENGERYYEYELDENGRPVAKMSEPIGSVFLCLDDITMYEIIMALLCESGLCDHDEGEHFKLEDLLVKYIYPVSIADIFDALLYDKDGNFIAPETVQIIYEAIKDNTIGDIVAVANGEQGYETLLENLYKLCLDDLVGMIIDFDVLPKVLKNIYDKIAYIPIGEIVEDWQVVLRALYTITVDDLVGEFIDRETLYEGLLKLYDCIKDISIQNVIDAVNNKEYYKLYEKFYSLTLLEVVLTEADRESIRTDNEKLYAVLETICGVSVGYIFEFLFCVTGLCETEGIVSPDHEHTGYFGLLDETVFELEISLLTEITIELIAGSEEDKDMLTDSLSGFIDAVDGMTVGEIFYALIASLGGDELAENLGVQDKVTQNFKELLLKYFGDKSFADIFSHFDKYLMPELFHPLAFALGFVFHVSVNDIIDFTENTNTLKFLDICEKYFYQYIESSYFDKYPEQIPYFNEEYPVSLGFLFGYWYYEMADFVVERTSDEEGNPVRGLMNCFDVLFLAYKDITLRDILTNKYALIDGLNHFTMGDFFGELLGFTYENGVWVNPDATATSSALFNAIADITPYDLIFDMDYTMVLYNFRIIDFVNLILDAVDPDRSVYNEVVPEAVREYINNVGQITFGDLIDGNVDPEIFIDSLGDITVGDIVKIFTDILGLTIPDNTLLNKILAVKLIDIARLRYHEIAANFTLYDFVQGILVELCGVELDRNFSIIDWWLNTWATVTVDDFIIFAEDPTAETGEWLVRKLLDGLTVEILADTVCEIIEPYQKHPGVMDNLALWRYISVLEVLDFIYDIDKVEEAVMNGLKETSVGEVIKFVLDLVDETIYDSLPQVVRKIIDNLCQIEFSFYSLITNIIDGPPENYAETLVRAFFKDVDINDFVLIFEDNLPEKLFTLELYIKVASILINDIIFDPDKVAEQLKGITVGDVVKTVLDLVDETIYDSLPQLARKLVDNLCLPEFSIYDIIKNIIDGPPSDYAETLVRAFFNDVDINDFVLLFEEYLPEKLFELELYKTISAILINDILFDQEKVLEQLKDISVGDVARTVLELTMEDYMSELPEGTLTILEALDKLTVAFFTEDLENRDLLKETLSVLFAEVNNGCYIDTILYIIYGSADPDGYDYDKVINILADVFANGYLYDTIYANDLYEFMYGFFGPLTFGGLIGIIDNYEAVSIDGKNLRETVEQVYEQLKLRFLEEIQLALFLSGPTPYEIFGEYTLRDVMGDRIDDIAYLSDIADEKIADLINTYLDFVPERLRVYVVTVVGVAVAVLVYLVYEYDLDTILTELNVEVPEAVRTTKLYSIYAFISLKDVITDWDTVWADIRGTSLGDFVDFVIAVIDPDYTPWPEMQRLIDNLYNITIGDFIDGEKDAEEYVRIALDTITVNLFLSFPPLYDITPEIVRNNGLYEFIAEIPLLELIFDHSALRDRVFAISVADLIIWGLEFADKEPDYSIVLIDKLLTNLDKITIFYIIEEFHWRDCLLKICGDITYRELIEGILDICGLDKNELPEEALFLVDTLLDNCADLYIRGLFEDPMDADWYAALEGVTLGMIFDAAFVLIYPEKEIDPILIENEPFKALRAIYLRDLISDFEGTVKQLADIKIGELIETLIRFFDVESWTSSFETVNKLIENTKDVSIDDIWQAVTGESLLGEYPPLTPFELLEKVLNDISWADVFSDIFLAFETAGIFSLDDAPQEYLPEATKDLIRKMLITNLEDSYVIRIFAENHYFPWYEMLAVTVDETFRGTFGAYIDIPEEVYECPLYVVYADVLIRDLIAHPDVYLNRFKDVTLGSMLIWALDLAGYEILYTNDFETKFVNNLNNITFGYFFESSFDILQLMRDIFESITFKDIVDCALDHADVDLAELPDKTEELVRLVIENLDKMPVNNLFEDPVIVPWYDMLEGITVRMIVDVIVELSGVSIPEKVYDCPLYIVYADAYIRDIIDNPEEYLNRFKDVTVGSMLIWALDLAGYEILYTNDFETKFVNNLNNITFGYFFESSFDILQLMRDIFESITFKDIVDCALDHADVDLAELPDKTEALVRLIIENLDKMPVNNLFEDPIIVPWYDMLEGITIGMIVESIAELVNVTMPEELVNGEPVKTIFAIELRELIDDPAKALEPLAEVALGDIAETFFKLFDAEYLITDYAIIYKLVNNAKNLTVDDLYQIFANETIVEEGPAMNATEFFRILLEDIYLLDVYNTVTSAVGDTLPEEIEKASLFVKVTGISLFDLFFVWDNVYEVIKSINIGETAELPLLLWYPEYDEYTIFDMLVENSRRVTFYALFTETSAEGIENNFKLILEGIQIRHINEFYEAHLPTVLTDSEIYGLVSDLYIARLIFNTRDEFAKLARASIGGILQTFVDIVKLDLSVYTALPVFIDNLKQLTIDHAAQAFFFQRLIAVSDNDGNDNTTGFNATVEAMMSARDFVTLMLFGIDCGMVLEDIYYIGGYTLTDELKATNLYNTLASIPVYSLVDVAEYKPLYENTLKYISVGDVLEIVFIYTPEFEKWPELEKLIDNMDNVNIGLIADAINEEITVQDFLKVAIFGISFKIITQIPAFEEKVPAWINDSSVYDKLTGINIYDVMYDKDAVLEDMKHIYIGEVTELCTEYMLPEWKTYGELVNKLNSNLKTISFYEIYDIFAGGANSLYFDSLGERIIVSITLGDIFDFVCGFRTEAEKYAPLADIIRDAEILALIKTLMSGSGAVGTYRSFMLLLIGDTVTVKDLLLAIEECELADIYLTYDAEYYIGLFDGRKLYYVLTQPTPSVLLGNVTFGMLFGRILGWTPENAEMTVWSGSGIFAEFANTLMVDIVNKTIAKLITDEYLQTVAIILCTAAAFGLYKLYQDNIDTIRDVLNKTVDEILDSLDLIKYKDDPNTKLGAIIYFLSENYGSMTVNEILVLINNKVYIELLRGVTVGEVYDLANILTDGKLDEFVNNAGEWQSNLDAFIAIVKHADIAEVFTAESGESMMLALFGQHTTAEVLGLVRINDKWCFNDKYVFPVQCLADMEFFLVVTIIMRGNIDEITSMLFNWTVMEAYQLFDPNMNRLVGVLGGTLVYKFVYAKANMSVITLISNFANGNFDDVTTVITMGDIKEVLPDNIVEQLGFVVTVFDNNYNVTLKEIIDSKDVVELLLAGIRMGDIMGYTKGACNVTDPGHVHNGTDCQYDWFDKDGNLLDVITNRFANTKLTTLISDDSVTFKTIIGDATLGELLSLTEGADGIWRDQNGVEVDVIRATIAPLLLADIMDNSEIILNAIDVIYIGELMNYTLVAGEWYEADGSKVDTLIAKFADLTIGEIRKGTVDFESLFNDVKLGEVMKYYLYDFGDGNGPVWSYTDSEGNTVPANKIPAAIADLTVGEIIDPAFDFVGFFRSTSLYVGDFMGYYSTTVYNPDTDKYELKWFSDKSFALEYEITDPVEAAFANTSLANLFDPDFDKISIIEDVYIGNLMHYERYDFGDGVVWAKPNGDGTFTQVTDKVIIALADLTLGKVLKDFDISLIVKDMYIGDIIGYTFDGSVWKDTDDNEITNPVTLAFINIRMEALVDKNNPFDFIAVVNDLYLGELMGNIRDPLTGEWYDGDGTPLDNQDKLALALMNTKISDYFGITINFENIFSGLKLGDILGKKEISGIWYESEGVRASSMMNILYGLDLVGLMYYDVSMKETINNMTLAELLDLDPSTTGILGSFMTLKVSELTEDNIRNKINGLTVSDIFTDMTGVLALIPASTTIEELPTALASAVNNATLADLENAGIMVATPAQLDTITDLLNANPNDTTIYTADQLQIMTISELIAKIVEAADGVLTLIP